MTKPFQPTTLQSQTLERIVSLANQRAGRNVNSTLELLRNAGFDPLWRRVVWTGGVGSYRWMPRRRRYRILVAATKSGYKESKTITIYPAPGLVQLSNSKPQRIGFRYGWCIEC